MKMKEVLASTGLTDRAVRLYISEGLLRPHNDPSYSGRKNLNFSQEDIHQLQQIAVLRKADFSIGQIRLLKQDTHTAAQVLRQYIEDKRSSLSQSQKILCALETIPPEQNITVSLICSRIESSLAEQPVPKEDLKPSIPWRIGAWVIRIISLCAFLFFGITFLGVLIMLRENYPFPKLQPDFFCHLGMIYLIISLLCFAAVFVLYVCRVLSRKARIRRAVAAGILATVGILNLFNPYGFAALLLVDPVYSETSSPDNYLVFGDYVKYYGGDIRTLFPVEVPSYASYDYPPTEYKESTQYYYYYDDMVDPCYDVYAQWELTETDFIAELERIQYMYPEGPVETLQWGDWVCMNYNYYSYHDLMAEAERTDSSYDFMIFAYNEKRHMVRYIATYAMDGSPQGPYFLRLDWE